MSVIPSLLGDCINANSKEAEQRAVSAPSRWASVVRTSQSPTHADTTGTSTNWYSAGRRPSGGSRRRSSDVGGGASVEGSAYDDVFETNNDEPAPAPSPSSAGGSKPAPASNWRDAEEDWLLRRNKPYSPAPAPTTVPSAPLEINKPVGLAPAPASPAEKIGGSSAVTDAEQRLRLEAERQQRVKNARMRSVVGMFRSGSSSPAQSSWRERKDREQKEREEQEKLMKLKAAEAFAAIPPKSPGEHWKTTLRLKKAREAQEALLEEQRRHQEEETKWKGIPEWKRKLLEARKKAEWDAGASARAAAAREEEEKNKWDALPSWKQALILARKK